MRTVSGDGVGLGLAKEGAVERQASSASENTLDLRWLELSPEPALICRFDRQIVWANRTFADLAGRPLAELYGLDCAALAPAAERPALEHSFRRAAQGEVLSDLLGRFARDQGPSGWLAWALIPDPDRATCLALGRRLRAKQSRPGEARPYLRELRDALERIIEGFALFDADDRLVYCNARFRDLYPCLRESRCETPSFEQLTRELAYSGLLPAAVGREETWIEERLRYHGQPSGIRYFKLGDGRWMQVDEQRTGSGGSGGPQRRDRAQASRRTPCSRPRSTRPAIRSS